MFLQYAIQCFTTGQTVEFKAVVVGYFIKIPCNIITILFNLQTQHSKLLLSDRFFVFI